MSDGSGSSQASWLNQFRMGAYPAGPNARPAINLVRLLGLGRNIHFWSRNS